MGFDLAKARGLMEAMDIDCIVATSHDNVYYSSGSDIHTIITLKRLAVIFLPLDSNPVFGVHANEKVTACESTWIKDVRVYEGGEWEPLKPIELIADVLREKGLSKAKIGAELLDMPGLCLDHLRELLPLAKFVNCQPIFDKMRSVKSTEELKLLSDANMATAKAITVAFEMARPGNTERDIAQNMMDLTIEYGADHIAFINLGAGKNILEIHHTPTDYRIKKRDMLHVDFGAFFKGYMSDISRMAVVGKPGEVQLKAYNIAVQAEFATAKAMHEGVAVMDVHNAVKQFYESKGYQYNKAFIGHSLGIGCHEFPFLGPSHGEWVLEQRMFFQIEPSLTIGHVRVHTEDSFIVTKGTARNVSEYRNISELQIIK